MDATLGWLFVALAALAPVACLAGRFYPTHPRFAVRLAAPVIFGLIAGACFAGYGIPASGVVTQLGVSQIVASRRAAGVRSTAA